MDSLLKQDIDHLFSVFRNNTLMDLHQLLPPDPAAKRYQAALEQELTAFHAAVMNRLAQEPEH